MLPEAVLHGDEKKRFAGWGFPVVLGFAFACGTNASTDAIVPFNRPYFYVQWLLFAVLFLVVFQVGFKIVQMGASSSLVKQVSEANTSSEKSSLLLFDYDQSKKTKFKDSLRILAASSVDTYEHPSLHNKIYNLPISSCIPLLGSKNNQPN